MSQSAMPEVLQASDLRLLTEIGMLGAGAGASLSGCTRSLFEGLMTLRPARDFGYIGLACSHLNHQRPEDAVRVLEQGLRIMDSSGAEPQGEDVAMVKAFLGMALLMARRTAEALALLESVCNSTQHLPALRMSQGLLGLPFNNALKENL